MRRQIFKYLIVAFLSVVPSIILACPSCYGDPNSPMTDGMNAAIGVLLGITGGMLGLFGVFFLYLRKRWVMLNRRFQNLLN